MGFRTRYIKLAPKKQRRCEILFRQSSTTSDCLKHFPMNTRHLPSSSFVIVALPGSEWEKSIDKAAAIAALNRLHPKIAVGGTLKEYFEDRGRIIDDVFGGHISFQVR